MTTFTHNDLTDGNEVKITGCNGKWTIAEIVDGFRGVRVIPEDGATPLGIWVDVSEITDLLNEVN